MSNLSAMNKQNHTTGHLRACGYSPAVLPELGGSKWKKCPVV